MLISWPDDWSDVVRSDYERRADGHRAYIAALDWVRLELVQTLSTADDARIASEIGIRLSRWHDEWARTVLKG